MSKDTLCGILALILFCWGSVLVVLCLQVLPPFELGAAIFFIGYIMLTLLQLARGKNVITPWKQAPVIYMGAVSGIGIYTVLIYAAFKMEPAFEVNVLNYLWPIFMVVFSMVLRKSALNMLHIAGAAMGFIGMVLLFKGPGQSLIPEDISLGHGLAVMGAAIWAAYSIWAKGQNYTSSFMGPVMLISSLLCLIAHVMWEETAWPYTLAGGLVVFTLGAFRVSYVLWDIGMRRGDTLLLTSLSYCVPLASTLLMIAFGFKPEHPGIALGGALIVLGCLTVNADKLLKLFRQRLVPAA